MADHIPFVTSKESCRLVSKIYADSDIARVPLVDSTKDLVSLLPSGMEVWLDPCADGMHDLRSRRGKPDKVNTWFRWMCSLPHFERIGTPPHEAKKTEVDAFVQAMMDKCEEHRPAWITVPQFPLIAGSDRNSINRELAAATGRWRESRSFSGRLILPVVIMSRDQVRLKSVRGQKAQQAERCYREAGADGLWVVEASLKDESGLSTLRKRFLWIIAFHEELNGRISSRMKIAGPYWGLNLVLWSKGLVERPAIGVGSRYQYLLPGGPGRPPTARIALPSLRRRVGVGPELRKWLDDAIAKLGPSHPTHTEFREIRKQYTALSGQEQAREQVARFYKEWFNTMATVPEAGRPMALFQDLSAAFALGRSLKRLGAAEKAARRPEAVAEPLMLSCL